MNEVAQDSTVRLIQRAINLGVRVAEIYVDTVGPPEKYQVSYRLVQSLRPLSLISKLISYFGKLGENKTFMIRIGP